MRGNSVVLLCVLLLGLGWYGSVSHGGSALQMVGFVVYGEGGGGDDVGEDNGTDGDNTSDDGGDSNGGESGGGEGGSE